MTALERMKQILSAEGYPVNLTQLSGGLSGPLIVSFRDAEQARERQHGQYIDQALSEKLDGETLLYALDSSGQKPQPLFSQSLVSS